MKKAVRSMVVLALAGFASVQAGRSCTFGNVTCNTYLGTACDGACDSDVCIGTQQDEYSCTDGSIQFVSE